MQLANNPEEFTIAGERGTMKEVMADEAIGRDVFKVSVAPVISLIVGYILQ